MSVERLLVQVTKLPATDFDLGMTLNSGQVFHWHRIDKRAGDNRVTSTGKSARVDEPEDESNNRFYGTIGDRAFCIEQPGDVLNAWTGTEELDRFHRSSLESMVACYFALDHPLADICESFPNDPAMNAAREFCRGLRIIRQPKWECLATFICSSMKQIAHIRQISQKLRERFGQARKIDRSVVYTFPTADRIAASTEKELRQCSLGYRAKNLLATARLVAGGDVSLERLATLADVDLRVRLCALPGVGAKVANCVMLFAYERLRAFPIDVWVERVLREEYLPHKRRLNAERLRAFTENYFGDHGGYAQQYLFHYARMNKGQIKSKVRTRGRAGSLSRSQA